MEQRIEEVTAMQERESAKKAVEEALAQEREKISLLTTEIEGLKDLLVAERDETDLMKSSHASALERNEELNKKLKDADEKIKQFSDIIQRLEGTVREGEDLLLTERQKSEAANTALAESEAKNEALLSKLEDAVKQNDILQETVKRHEESITVLETSLRTERQQNEAIMKQLADSQGEIGELQEKLEGADGRNSLLQDSLQRLEQDVNAKDALLLTEKQAHETAQKTLAEVHERNEELLKKIHDDDKTILQLKFTIQRSIAVSWLEENTAANENMLLREKEQNDATTKAHIESQERYEVLLKKFLDVDRKIDLLQDTIESLGENTTTKDALLLSERQEKDAIKKALTEAEEKKDELLMKVEDSNEKIEHLQNTINKLEENITAKDVSLEAAMQENETIRKLLAEAQEKNDELLKKINDSEYRMHLLQDTVQKLQVDAISRLSSFVMEKQESDAAKRAVSEAHERNEDLLRRNEDLLKRNDDLIKKIEESDTSDSMNRLEGKAANLEAENQVLRQQSTGTPPSTAKSSASRSKITRIHKNPDNGHILNGDIKQTEMKPSTGTSEATSVGNAPNLGTPKDFEHGEKLQRVFNQKFQSAVGSSGLPQVEAKYPALLFKQQLVDLIEKVYGMISDSVKKELNPLLELCIQDPRTSHSGLAKGHLNGMGQSNQLAHWLGIVKILTSYLDVLRANHVPPILVNKLFTQIFSLIDVQLFNRLLLRRECCSFSNGEYVRAGLAELKHWSDNATREFAGSAWEALRHIRQAVDFLVISLKPMRTLREIRTDVCPALSIQQLERIVSMYWDDVNGTNTISAEFTSSLKTAAREESNTVTTFSILLDDDSSIPFSLDDITKTLPAIEMVDDDLLPFVRENPNFAFLLQRGE
ncbi:hypothetical protein PR202_ga09896 [Eleusine coracana subsp. coracana]|uniref:Dilute domain-containing protein n=1 Tax=Eleusine coracana subsp. coracana TaxID=191504 RepID=A0AAV5C5G9_ELECO|nr:hypothetical protein PR202_ga09896 [Eleusine coracana subsp. coracana]